jgi:putative hydrolase of the HAD superfamily
MRRRFRVRPWGEGSPRSPGSSTRMRFAELDAVTLDAHGTLVEVANPVPALQRALGARGVEREPDAIAEAFEVEGSYYRARSFQGRDAESLAGLRRECVGVFLDALGCDLGSDEFTPAYMDSIRFELISGTHGALVRLRRHGLALAVVSNWDLTLSGHLAELGLGHLLDAVVTSAGTGVAKPDPAPFLQAIELLGVSPERTLHVGDSAADEHGARAAGLHFTPAPLVRALGDAA